jgi:hypothetical protein
MLETGPAAFDSGIDGTMPRDKIVTSLSLGPSGHGERRE